MFDKILFFHHFFLIAAMENIIDIVRNQKKCGLGLTNTIAPEENSLIIWKE
jgi:hypothetical protein